MRWPTYRASIGTLPKELDDLRSRWLNPPEWTREEILEFPGSTAGPWARYVTDADERGIGTARYPRIVPQDDAAAELLAKRTLTNLYNERPPGSTSRIANSMNQCSRPTAGTRRCRTEILARLLAPNQERAAG